MGLLNRAIRRLRDTALSSPPANQPTAPQAPSVQRPSFGRARDTIDPNELARARRDGYDRWSSTSALYNAVTGIGTEKDPASFNIWVPQRPLDRFEQFGMGRNALAFQALNKKPSTATREGWRVNVTDKRLPELGTDKDTVAKQIRAYEERLGIGQATARCAFRTFQYGSAFVLLGIDDGHTFDQPVDMANIRTIKWAVVFDERDFYPIELYEPDSDHFSRIKRFQITDINGCLNDGLRYGWRSITYARNELETAAEKNGGRLVVHADRVLYFSTVDNFSLFDTLQDSLGGFFESMNGIRTSARESSTVIYKIGKWLRKMWSENASLATTHMGFVDRAKNALNAWVIDKDEEDIDIKARSLGGVSQLADPFMVWLAAALAIPVTVLWGVSPGGFGKGEAERDTWHEEVRAFQKDTFTPQLQRVHAYILVAQDGCKLPADLERVIEYNDLSPPDEQTRSDLRDKAINALRLLADGGYLTREELRDSLPTDEWFHPKFSDVVDDTTLAPAPVGVVTGGIALLQAVYPNGIPLFAAREFMQLTDPQRFTSGSVARIFPDAPTPEPTQQTPASASPSGTPPSTQPVAVDPDAEDAAAEAAEIDAELTALFSQVKSAVPTDAKTAQEVAAEITQSGIAVKPDQIKRRAKAGEFAVYPPEGFSTRPRFSVSEVKKALLVRHGVLPAETTTEEQPKPEPEPETITDKLVRVDDWSETSACIVLRLPLALARWVPYKEQDKSAPHVTLLYLGDITPEQKQSLFNALREWVAALPPFTVTLFGNVDYFDNEQRIAYAVTGFDVDAQTLHDGLKDLAVVLDQDLAHHDYGGTFTPHVTLAYLSSGETYDGPVPKGTWQVDSIELWHGEHVDVIPVATDVVRDSADCKRCEGAGWLWRHEIHDSAWDGSSDDTRYTCDTCEGSGICPTFDAFVEGEWLVEAEDMSEEAKAKRIAEAFEKYHVTVNMGAAELREWAKSEWAKKASLSREPIERNLRLLETPREKWTLAHAASAMRTVNFVSRMKGTEQGKPVTIEGRKGPSKRDISLKNWAFNPSKA